MISKWSDPAVGARTVTVFTDALARLVGRISLHMMRFPSAGQRESHFRGVNRARS